MPPKRKLADRQAEGEAVDLQRGRRNQNGRAGQPAANEAAQRAAPVLVAPPNRRGRQPETLKEKILDLLRKREELVDLKAIKKILKEDYGLENNRANGTLVKTALQDLEAEDRVDFGRIDDNYHAGIESVAYLAHIQAMTSDLESEEDSDFNDPGTESDDPSSVDEYGEPGDYELKCPDCGYIMNEDEGTINSDSTTGGLCWTCDKCGCWFHEGHADHGRLRSG